MRRARPAFAAWLREQGVVALEDVDTRALVRRIRDGGVLRCALGEAPPEELLARALAEPPIDGRPLDREVGTRGAVRARRRAAGHGARPRLQALDPARGWRRAASRRSSSPATGTPTPCSRPSRARCSSPTGPATRPSSPAQIETVRDLLGRVPLFGICLGPPARRARARPGDVQAPLRPSRGEPPGPRRAQRPRARHRPEPRLRGRARPTASRSAHVSLNDGTVEGLAGEDFATVQFHPEAAPGPLDALPFFDGIARDVPKRTDLRSLLIVGSGPIRIGQACEFDYSGAQACRVLRREGYRVVLVNSNPATIMTDPEWADATYLEPLDAETRGGGDRARAAGRAPADARRPDGPQPRGRAARGGRARAPRRRARRRERRRDPPRRGPARASAAAMEAAGLPVAGEPRRRLASTSSTGCRCPRSCGRRSRSAARGGGLARDARRARARWSPRGLAASPIGQVLVERSLEGWQEHELEVMADAAGNCVVVCSIENLDPMGVHTGDSWTVAPQQTLSDPEFQRLREAAFACARAVGVATGGANVQFAYEPATRELVVIEMNPRVSRSSALASKATGFPIAKLAALLAVGYTLDELPNDITGKTTAAFEPALDYVAVKAPRFDFAKFPEADARLGSEMRAVGEALGLGRTFAEAFLKALEGREAEPAALDLVAARRAGARALGSPARGGAAGPRPARDPPLLRRRAARDRRRRARARRERRRRRRQALRPARLARSRGVLGIDEAEVRRRRPRPGRLAVDSCAGRVRGADALLLPLLRAGRRRRATAPRRRRSILGSGPNRIGQGIEFDYCCSRAALAFRRLGYEVALVNSNPETVSTDYDTSDRLYLEPLTLERVLDVCELEEPLGVVVSLGGQTPLRLAPELAAAGVPLLGDPLPAIERAEDRGRFGALLAELGLRAPAWGVAETTEEARALADRTRLSGARPPAPRPRRPRACASRAAPRSSRWTSRRSSTRSSRARSSSTSTRSATARTPGSRRSSSTSSRPASTRATRPACCRRRR